MSAERYEIHDFGELGIMVSAPTGGAAHLMGDHPDPHGHIVGAIRQQARDIAELRDVFETLRTDPAAVVVNMLRGTIAKIPPMAVAHTHGEVLTDLESANIAIAKLRADLASAVAERDDWNGCAMNVLAERDTLRARLAAIDGAYTVADVIAGLDGGKCVQERAFGLFVPDIGIELIARPAKES